ncbi:MAG: SCP2 sterol-binding domain-containing protein [Actinomycetia bacterium]|nr:SCP2 sterol-binding domain-containing protein [Actinomycetes bacterium]MCP4223474.1 SCP2 sterol-binding domain-containing protein [Actinomycetes bacterium]MCP5032525.1 SCP2 sterol-binding domain-containing protein [Actinomycetes bacterium]
MAAHPFLSDAWIEAARALRARYRDQMPPPPIPVRLNVVITEIPHRDEELEGHVDSTAGQTIIEHGHLAKPDLTITIDYATAKAAFVTRDQQAVMVAFFSGRIFVDGDASKLLALQATQPDEPDSDLEGLYREMRAFTAED